MAAGSIDKHIRIYEAYPAGNSHEVERLETKAGFLDSEIGYLAVHPNEKILIAAEETELKIFVYKIEANTTLTYLKTCEVNDGLVGNCDKPSVRSLLLTVDGRLALGLPSSVRICDVKTDAGGVDPLHT